MKHKLTAAAAVASLMFLQSASAYQTEMDMTEGFFKAVSSGEVVRVKELLKADPHHPSLHLKKVDQLWSVRVGAHYRALGMDGPDAIVWFWIGSHAEYDKLV